MQPLAVERAATAARTPSLAPPRTPANPHPPTPYSSLFPLGRLSEPSLYSASLSPQALVC